MTTPTQEAAEIVAGLLGGDYTADKVLVATISCPAIAFARYVTEETEVTDAMLEAGLEVYNAGSFATAEAHMAAMHRAMIAAKHKGLRKVEEDALHEAVTEAWAWRNIKPHRQMTDELREALAKRGKMIADIPAEAPAIDEEAVKREAREKLAATNDGWEALITTTRELHLLRAKVGGQP